MTPSWRPTASIQHLKERARILAIIRDFFALRRVTEVETPSMSLATVTDPHLHSLTTACLIPDNATPHQFYLQTSPEYAMKRLLAAGSGPIYQIGKCYRADERGNLHNPEFTMLEWYRPGFTHRDLMIEMDGLLRKVLGCEVAQCETYGELFERFCQINPYRTTVAELRQYAEQLDLTLHNDDAIQDVTTWLQLIMTKVIEPHLGFNNRPSFVIDFPAEQAALAKIDPGPPAVAERFEVYWQGMELANGFHELCDAKEQRRRFEANNHYRREHGMPEIDIDENFLAALEHGLPSCAGVALGIDRLMMAVLQVKNIEEVIAFPIESS